jgi:hypothetical protein
MVYRAFDLGMIDEFERSILYRNMTRRRWRGPLQEPFDSRSEMPLEQPRMLRRGVDAVLKEGIFGRLGLLEALALPEREVEQLAGLESGFFNKADVIQLATIKRGPLKALDMETGMLVEFPLREKGST